MGSFAMAEEVSIDLTSKSFKGTVTQGTYSKSDFTFTLDKANSTTDNNYTYAELRVYKGATLTISGDKGQQMTKIVLTGKGTMNNIAVGSNTYTWSNSTITWEGDATSVTFDAAAGQSRIIKAVITYVPAGGVVVSAPEISPAGGRFAEAQTVSISAGAGCKIYYTLDGQAPTDDVNDGSTKLYTAPFTVAETTTVKAIAFDADDNHSSVATQTYTIVTPIEGAEGDGTEANPYNTIAALNEANLGSTATVFVKGTVVSISELSTQYGNATYYISPDGTEANQLYVFRGYGLNGEKFTAEDELKVGDKVVVKGALMLYNGAPQIGTGSSIMKINDQQAEKYVPTGDGSVENPFTVADVIGINPKNSGANEDYPDKYWVKGYIAGAVNGQVFADAILGTTAGIESQSNIVLAPSASTTEVVLCIPVQLPTGDVRTALNLVDNPTILGKEVMVYGNIYAYFLNPGVKNVTEYKLDPSAIEAVEAAEADAPVVYYNLQGVKVANPAAGNLYIRVQGNSSAKVRF